MAETSKPQSPPYATLGNLIGFFNRLKETSVPTRIDPTVFGNASGSVVYSVLAALKFLKLIDEEGRPSDAFERIVNADDAGRSLEMKSLLQAAYPSLFSTEIDLRRASAGEFDEHLRKQFGIQGSTVDKVAAFFIGAAKMAGIELSTQIDSRKPAAVSGAKKSARGRKRPIEESAQEPAPLQAAATHASLQISEKALEYRLVDLMSEAAENSEVMAAIIKVITFLKTKPSINSQKGGTI